MVRPLVAVGLLVVAGVVGFSTLGGASVVDSVFWLLDPTSIELHYQTHEGPATLVKAYAIVILTGLLGTGLWAGETFVSAAFGGQIQAEIEQMKIERKIDELESHVVVCGYGTFGKTVASRLQSTGRGVVVVESQESQYRQALDAGFLTIEGDARREENLAAAGIKRASTLVGAIDDSKMNIQIAITASQLAPTAKLVVRAGDQMDEALARRAGADEVVVPEIVSGEQVCSNL